jgi:DNA polymerase sigma
LQNVSILTLLGETCSYTTDGMEKVICVSTAKVPIVKIWDPELCLACDMNVNNTLALENTRMIKTYVQLDDRVRPLAMIIKYWTKRRIVNDAGMNTIVMALNMY